MRRYDAPRALSIWTISALGLALACSDHEAPVTESTEKAEALNAPEAAAPKPEQVKRHHHGERKKHWGGRHQGPGMLLGAALRHLDLSEEQQSQIKELKSSLRGPKDKTARPPKREFKGVLEQSLRSGSIDRAAVDRGLSQMETQMKAKAERQVSVLNQLHSTLNAEQRTALVQAIEKRGSAKKHSFKGHGKGISHKAKLKPGKQGHRFPMLRGIELTQTQEQQLATLALSRKPSEGKREARERSRARRAALLKAFASDSFDAAELVDAEALVRQSRERAERHIAWMNDALTVLTAEQRAQLVQGRPGWRDRQIRGNRAPKPNQ